jgi:hypothetical protein
VPSGVLIEEDTDAASWVETINAGRPTPTLDIEGTVLSTPTDQQLDEGLGRG